MATALGDDSLDSVHDRYLRISV